MLGIDASNLRAGGGLSHLVQLLETADPPSHGFARVVLWTGSDTARKLPRRDWLHSFPVPDLDGSLARRTWWRSRHLPRSLRDHACHLLFAPGGTIPGTTPVPAVTMSRNMLPFDPRERQRYGLSRTGLELRVLREVQRRSFMAAEGVIFLTEYARETVCRDLARPPKRIAVIPHGVDDRFRRQPDDGDDEPEPRGTNAPFRWLYVSYVKPYKHQWQVVEATGKLLAEGVHVELDLVGPARPEALDRLRTEMSRRDPDGQRIRYLGPAPFEELHRRYRSADGFVFASSCENMPNILLEAMASGLPIACSDRGPMPEILGDAGRYFDPESAGSIADAMRRITEDPAGRRDLARKAYERSSGYSWKRCATETLEFLSSVLAETRERTPSSISGPGGSETKE